MHVGADESEPQHRQHGGAAGLVAEEEFDRQDVQGELQKKVIPLDVLESAAYPCCGTDDTYEDQHDSKLLRTTVLPAADHHRDDYSGKQGWKQMPIGRISQGSERRKVQSGPILEVNVNGGQGHQG